MPMMIESTDDVSVALHDLGGSGPPLLFLHATGFHGRCYTQVARHLHGHFHCFAPDLRGHGDSITPDIPLPWRGMVDDTLAVIDHLGLTEPVRAAGHSMGGATVVATERRRPGTIRAGWLFEPIIFPPLPQLVSQENPMAAAARRRRHDFASLDEAIDRYSGRGVFTDVDPAVLHDYVAHGFRATENGVTLKTTGEMEGRTFEGIDVALFDQLAHIQPPMTVVGSGDGQNPARAAGPVAEALPDGRLQEWPDRSHFGPFEDPERAARAILDSLA